jgi:hypothetical protein
MRGTRIEKELEIPPPPLIPVTETDPVSETSCFLFPRIPDDGDNKKNPIILIVIHHRQISLESTGSYTHIKLTFYVPILKKKQDQNRKSNLEELRIAFDKYCMKVQFSVHACGQC